ncbi:BQ2448_4713 [Microbotryum intermedium]|uniref:BQ2448_4713 protein n=1 Tax=Microbotryum intermedium TaxID=269621 RepID=A0A238FGU6_9BASI|nr:BQ2448_4713 [Microbotryum intermedium]
MADRSSYGKPQTLANRMSSNAGETSYHFQVAPRGANAGNLSLGNHSVDGRLARPAGTTQPLSIAATPGSAFSKSSTSIVHRLDDFQPNEGTKRTSAPPLVVAVAAPTSNTAPASGSGSGSGSGLGLGSGSASTSTSSSYNNSAPLQIGRPRNPSANYKTSVAGGWIDSAVPRAPISFNSSSGNSNSNSNGARPALLDRVTSAPGAASPSRTNGNGNSHSQDAGALASRIGTSRYSPSSPRRSRPTSPYRASSIPLRDRMPSIHHDRAPSNQSSRGATPPLPPPQHPPAASTSASSTLRDRLVASKADRREDEDYVVRRCRSLLDRPSELDSINPRGLRVVTVSNLPSNATRDNIYDNMELYGPVDAVTVTAESAPAGQQQYKSADVRFKYADDAACAVKIGNMSRFWIRSHHDQFYKIAKVTFQQATTLGLSAPSSLPPKPAVSSSAPAANATRNSTSSTSSTALPLAPSGSAASKPTSETTRAPETVPAVASQRSLASTLAPSRPVAPTPALAPALARSSRRSSSGTPPLPAPASAIVPAQHVSILPLPPHMSAAAVVVTPGLSGTAPAISQPVTTSIINPQQPKISFPFTKIPSQSGSSNPFSDPPTSSRGAMPATPTGGAGTSLAPTTGATSGSGASAPPQYTVTPVPAPVSTVATATPAPAAATSKQAPPSAVAEPRPGELNKFTVSGHDFVKAAVPAGAASSVPKTVTLAFTSPTYKNTGNSIGSKIGNGISLHLAQCGFVIMRMSWWRDEKATKDKSQKAQGGHGVLIAYVVPKSAPDNIMRMANTAFATAAPAVPAGIPIAVPSNSSKRPRDEPQAAGSASSTVPKSTAVNHCEKRPRVDPAPAPKTTASATLTEDVPMITLDDDVRVVRIELTESARGPTPAAAKARKLMRKQHTKRINSEGKIVLSAVWVPPGKPRLTQLAHSPIFTDECEYVPFSFKDDVLEITYEVDEEEDDAAQPMAATEAPQQPAPSAAAARRESSVSNIDEDVKPDKNALARVSPDDEEADMVMSEPEIPEREPVYFPREIRVCTADSVETRKAVEGFIDDFFSRFDSDRVSLQYLYHLESSFSVRVVPNVPPRMQGMYEHVHPFQRKFMVAAGKNYLTPTAIANAIVKLPAGSHDIENLIYDARVVSELRRGLPPSRLVPIVLHVHGTFEEFPEHIVRKVSRTFVLVPRDASTGGLNMQRSPYVIKTDQLVFSHYDPKAPTQLIVDPAQGPFVKNQGQGSSSPKKKRASESTNAAAPSLGTAPISQVPSFRKPTSSQAQAQASEPVPVAAAVSVSAGTGDSGAAESNNAIVPQAGPSNSAPAPAPALFNAHTTPARANPDVLVISDSSDESDSGSDAPSADTLEPARPRAPVHSPPNPLQGLPPPILRPRDTSESSSSSRQGSMPVDEVDDEESDTLDQPAVGAGQKRKKKKKSTVAPAAGSTVRLSVQQMERLVAKQVRAVMREQERERERKKKRKRRRARSDSDETDSDNDNDFNDDADNDDEEEGESDIVIPDGQPASLSGHRSDVSSAVRAKKRSKDKLHSASTSAPTLASPSSDGRIAISIGTSAISHGYDGKGNKMRWMIDIGSSFLGVSMWGDVIEWTGKVGPNAVRKLHESKGKTFAVDDIAFSRNKNVLVVPYLGGKIDKAGTAPNNQVMLYERKVDRQGLSKVVETPLSAQPHGRGGITATMVLPGAASARLQFITAGEDKMMYLWTRARSDRSISTERLPCEHTSTITSLNHLPSDGWLISGGADKRVVATNIEQRRNMWSALLPNAVYSVEPSPINPHLILSRQSSSSDQFRLYDTRQPGAGPPVLTFGFSLAPRAISTSSVPVAPNLGRYYAGSPLREFAYAFPDLQQGVKLWDLRKATSAIGGSGAGAGAGAGSSSLVPRMQSMHGVANSKVVQVLCRKDELALMEQQGFTSVRIR